MDQDLKTRGGVADGSLPDVRSFPHADLGKPLVVTPATAELAGSLDAFVDWYRTQRERLEDLLVQEGAVVLRGFPVRDTADFERLIEFHRPHRTGYVAGATPRQLIRNKVYESSKVPPEFSLTLHQEKSYMPHHPRIVAFFCRKPADEGGETTLADMRRVHARLPAELVETFARRGVRYMRNFRYPEEGLRLPYYHRTLVQAFGTIDREEIEAACRAVGLDYEWLSDGSITVSNVGVATIRHPVTGEELWFNQASLQHPNRRSLGKHFDLVARIYADRPVWPFSVTFGDGGGIDPALLEPVYQALDDHTLPFPWETGDLLLLDNILFAHGRNPYRGEREIQVAMYD